MIIQHNIPAMNSHRNLGINNAATAKNLEKLSSGYKINRAGDDAAGLAISEKMRGQIRGLAMATQNAQNGVSLIQTAEGGLNETHAILQRMRELAVQSANGTYDDDVDRANITKEVKALKAEIDRIATSTHYNGIKLLDGNLDPNGISATASTATDTTVSAISLTPAENASDGEPPAVSFAGKDITVDVMADDTGAITYKVTIDGTTYAATGTVAAGANTLTLTGTGGADQSGSGTDGLDATFKFTLGTVPANGTGIRIQGKIDNAEAALTGVSYSTIKDGAALTFQIGANGTADQRVDLVVRSMDSKNIGVMGANNKIVLGKSINDIDVGTREDANDAIAIIDAATNWVSGTRADLGALQNRLEHTINNLGVTRENLQAAESSIRDVDMAKEMMEFTKNNILVQASQAMLAQANQLPQGVLQLLR